MPDIAATVSRRENRGAARQTAPLRGYLTGLPRVGAPMILIVPSRDGDVDRLITSRVQRVLRDPNGTLFVETRQSVYRVTLDEPLQALPPLSQMPTSFDSFDLTIAPDSLADDTSDGAEND